MIIKKTYIPSKPRNPKLSPATGTMGTMGGVGKTDFSQVAGSSHEHSNKSLLDSISQSNIDVLEKLSVDDDGNIKVDTNLWATGGISAFGLGDEGSGGSGGGIDRLDSWANYTEAKANYYAPASLLVPFRNDTLSRLASLEAGGGGGGDVEISITGSGNAITGVSKDENTLTFAKSSTFALSSHNHTIAQVTGLQSALNAKQNTLIAGANITISGNTISASGGISSVAWADITDKPSTFAPSAHTHLWADITDKPTTFATLNS